MPEHAGFIDHQMAFAAHIRDPARCPRPADVEERRMAIYRDLFYNNLESLLASAFPVVRELLSTDHWHAMVRDFYSRHRCQTPLFLEIGQEFLAYLQDERTAESGDPPFLLELAHYEWVELAVSIAEEEEDPATIDPNGDLLDGIPVRSSVAFNLSYHFPVHRIAPDFRPAQASEQPNHLLVYRDRSDDVGFMEINTVTQRLLVLLQEHPDWTGLGCIEQIATELRHPQPDTVIAAGKQLLEDLRARNVLLGTRR